MITLILISLILISLILFYKRSLNKSNFLNCLYIDKSRIENAGRGIFTSKPIKKGTYLFSTLINGKITPPGAMINHCNNPNTNHVI